MGEPAAAAAQYVEWEGTPVPPSVKRALEARFRGQVGIGGKAPLGFGPAGIRLQFGR